jgi:hypothetical protein
VLVEGVGVAMIVAVDTDVDRSRSVLGESPRSYCENM